MIFSNLSATIINHGCAQDSLASAFQKASYPSPKDPPSPGRSRNSQWGVASGMQVVASSIA
jgi:hypothetical protein